MDLNSYIPSLIANTKALTEIFNTENQELNALDVNIADIKSQLNFETATWALDIYEKELGIATDYTKSLDYRRSVIKSKWRGSGKLTAAMIKIVCDSFSNGNVDVIFDGTIHIKFNSVIGIPPNMSDLQNAVNEIKPAYLLLDYLFAYLLIKDIDGVMTINQLQTKKLNEFAGGA